MAAEVKDERFFWLNLTEETIYELAEEEDIKREQITPEVMEKVKAVVLWQFREWDNWLKEVIWKEIHDC